jgi:Ca2+/Na+ antiporter
MGLRLHRIYVVLAIFVAYDALQSIVAVVELVTRNPHIDDRVIWMIMRSAAWVLTLWMVHSLLAAILRKLPGISRLSRILFNSVFLGATVLALLTAVPEYLRRGSSEADLINRALVIGVALERAMSIAAVLVLLTMLVFILWFPVQMPRNLAVFSGGLVVYFGANTGLFLMFTYLPRFYVEYRNSISVAAAFLSAACFAYWTLFISARGEAKEIRLGHSWEAGEQRKLIGQLEAMNAALLASKTSGV